MPESDMTLSEYQPTIGAVLDGDFLREGVRFPAELLTEGDVTEQIGMGR